MTNVAIAMLLATSGEVEGTKLNEIESLQLMSLSKNSDQENELDNQELLQIQSNLIAHHKIKSVDDVDIAAVEDIMNQYDAKEKVEKQNEEFIKVLKGNDKLLSFFIENYSPG